MSRKSQYFALILLMALNLNCDFCYAVGSTTLSGISKPASQDLSPAGSYSEIHYINYPNAPAGWTPSTICPTGSTLTSEGIQSYTYASNTWQYTCYMSYSHQDLTKNTNYLNEYGQWLKQSVSGAPGAIEIITIPPPNGYAATSFVSTSLINLGPYVSGTKGGYAQYANTSKLTLTLNTQSASSGYSAQGGNTTGTLGATGLVPYLTYKLVKNVNYTWPGMSSYNYNVSCTSYFSLTPAQLGQTLYIDCCPVASLAYSFTPPSVTDPGDGSVATTVISTTNPKPCP